MSDVCDFGRLLWRTSQAPNDADADELYSSATVVALRLDELNDENIFIVTIKIAANGDAEHELRIPANPADIARYVRLLGREIVTAQQFKTHMDERRQLLKQYCNGAHQIVVNGVPKTWQQIFGNSGGNLIYFNDGNWFVAGQLRVERFSDPHIARLVDLSNACNNILRYNSVVIDFTHTKFISTERCIWLWNCYPTYPVYTLQEILEKVTLLLNLVTVRGIIRIKVNRLPMRMRAAFLAITTKPVVFY